MAIKILLTGGGTGGHIFPLIAVSEAIREIDSNTTSLFYIGPKNFLNEEFNKRNIKVSAILSAKLRRYFSFHNLLDIPKFIISLFQAFFWIGFLRPDVVFSKGGPGAFQVVFAASFFKIPIIIHESDTVPGLTNKISSKFAKKIAISFEGARKFFDKNKIILIGNPIRKELFENALPKETAKKELGFDSNGFLLFILGGSQGSAFLNKIIFENREEILKIAQIFHQTGEKNSINGNEKANYKQVKMLDAENMHLALSAANLVVSRAGSGAIFEIAAFGKPSILIPLDGAANDHQKSNAYEYANTGAAIVIEEANFKFNLVLTQIKNILENKEVAEKMSAAAKRFAKTDAAEIIAKEILSFMNK